MKQAHDKQPAVEEVLKKAQEEIKTLSEQLAASQEREKRVLADYQNLQRRSQEERAIFIRMANREMCEAILQPLEHLSMAASSIKDKGLDMVVDQFWKELRGFGLEEIDAMGKDFDLSTMEVIDKKGNGEKVIEVARKGYTLNGEVIQHAQVILA